MIRALIAWLLMAGTAMAQDIAVQAGEHAGYTRLALRIGTDADWRFGRTPTGYGLRIDAGRDFATENVFDVVGRDRIASLVGSAGQLDLRVNCACHAAVFVHAAEWLVIDIADGPAGPDDPFEQPLVPLLPTRAAGLLPTVSFPAAPFFLLPGAFPGALEGAATPPGPTVAQIAPEMVQAITRAAGQGLLDLADTQPVQPTRATPAPPPLPETPMVPQVAPGLPGLAAHSAADQLPGHIPTAVVCPSADAFDLAAWAGSGDLATETAMRWAALTDARDRVIADAAEALARTYVAFGFGREALQVLALDPRDAVSRDQLAILAYIIDDRPVSPDSFARAAECPGPLSLWQALATGTVADLAEPARTAAVIAFRALPMPLRGQLGPRLASAFAAAGDPLAAQELLDPQEDAVASSAVVETAVAAGDMSAAVGTLQEMARTDPRLTPEDLVNLVDLALAEGRPLDPAVAELLRAARFEYRNRPEEAVLLRAEIRLLSASGQHAVALARVNELPAIQRDDALGPALIALSQTPDSIGFTETYFASVTQPVPEMAVHPLANRLIQEGFPDVALTLLAPATNGPAMAERRYLRATAAAALGRQDLVDAALLGLNDSRAMAIRAGNGAGADPEWRTGDWAALVASPDPLMADIATARTTPARGIDAMTDTAPPLAARQSLLSDSRATRALARALLDRFSAQ